MPGYKPQVKTNSGMVDIPIAATYDENGNEIKKYVSTFSQTFTDEEKAQARANIGAANASGGGKVYRHCVKVDLVHTKSGRDQYSTFAFDVFLSSANELTSANIRKILSGMAVAPKSGKYMMNDLPDTLQDIGYVIFSTSGTVSVFHYLVSTGVSLSNNSTIYFQSGSATMTVMDFVQEMP